jgi:hypothetical protein
MRRVADKVKPLALLHGIWHRAVMSDDSDIKQKQREARLREALRANLRRRKAKPAGTESSSPKSAD